MRPSQQRQLVYWTRFWVKVSGLFAVTMACLGIAASAYRDANGLSEKSQAAVRAAIQSGQIQAAPLAATPRLRPASTIIIISPPPDDPPPSHPPPPPGDPPPDKKVSTTTPAITLIRDAGDVLTLTSPSDFGATYYLDASLDLRAWVAISTNTATDQTVSFTLSNSPAIGNVFYRLRTPGQSIFVSPTGQSSSRQGRVSRVVSTAEILSR